MKKALELLRRELQNNYEKRPFIIKRELYHKEKIEDFHKAIEELQEFQNRSCATCKYGHTYHFDEDIECMKLGADTQGLYFEKDFYCKNWESR